MTGFYHDERCFWHTTGEAALFLPVGGWVQPMSGGGHAENPETKRRLLNLVKVSGLGAHLNWREGPPVTRENLARVHDAAYLDDFKRLSDAGGGILGHDAPFGRGSYEVACVSAGLVKQAVADVLTHGGNAYVLSRPPGHHCLPSGAMGFCMFNNIAVAVEAARATAPLRVAVVDWDVHHGNGTEAVYYDRDDTLTISIHQERCFPLDTGGAEDRGRDAGQGFNLNIPLWPGGGHQAYLDAMELLVAPAIRAFRPDLIVIACGLDANSVDPLARMQATPETFRAMTATLKTLAAELCQGRLIAVHEGGYSEVEVPFCGLAVIEELAGHRTPVVSPLLDWAEQQQPAADMIAAQRARLQAQAKGVFG
ncbi:MAG: class II histone deacetylase [Paracoccaceae bacterium]